MNKLNKQIRQVKQQLINNLDDSFNPINIELDVALESKLAKLYAERKQVQKLKINTLSEMYLRIYAWS